MTDTAVTAFPAYRCTVLPEWIDYNGHLSEAFYVLVFGFATDHVMDSLGMHEAYRRSTGNSLYTVEAHVRYLAETGLGAELTVSTQIVGGGAKKLHLAHEMRSAEKLIATEELLALHVDQDSGRSSEFPAPIRDNISRYRDGLDDEAPDWIGRTVSS